MTKPFSNDLHERAVARVSVGESVRSVAAVLCISASSVVKWAQRARSTGSVAPGKMGGHRPRVLVGQHRDWLLERMKSNFTLRGLVAELGARGVKVTTARSGILCAPSASASKKSVLPAEQDA